MISNTMGGDAKASASEVSGKNKHHFQLLVNCHNIKYVDWISFCYQSYKHGIPMMEKTYVWPFWILRQMLVVESNAQQKISSFSF